MARRRRTSGLITAALLGVALTVFGTVATPDGMVSAGDQPVVTGTSPTTGITYTGTYSCVEQRPSFIASRPASLAFVDLEAVRDGEITYTSRQYVESVDTDSRVSFDRAGVPRAGRIDVDRFQLRDTIAVGRAPGEFGPVFLTLTPSACPDYNAPDTGAFLSITPQRVLDTRMGREVNYSGGKPTDGASITVPSGVMPDRPDGVTAVSLTLTLAQPSSRGFGQVYPSDTVDAGASSNVNTSGPGVNTANSAIVPVAADGSFSVFVNRSAHVVVDINGYFVRNSGDVSAGRFESVDPKRLFDTRPDTQTNYSGSKPGNAATVTVDLAALESGLPPGATAAMVNITATRTTGPGFVQGAAAGELEPGASSVLNASRADQSVAGLSIVPLSSDGAIDLYTLRSADLIVDLIGWFTGESADASSSGLFVPVPPERVRDTRRATSLNQETFGGAGGCCNSTGAQIGFTALAGLASAVVLNLTAIDGGQRGFIQIGGGSEPFSSINFPGSGAVANAAVVPFATRDACCARRGMSSSSGTSPDLVADLSGYFTR